MSSSSSSRMQRGESGTTSPEILFANKEAFKLHGAFGGLRVEADGRLRYPVPENLENIRTVVVEFKGPGSELKLQPNLSEDQVHKWNQLLINLAETEVNATELNKGAFQKIFSRVCMTIGNKTEIIDPWVNLIPNEYGLCIIKSGLLILLKLAQRYTDKRQKIIDGFLEIRRVICDALLKRRSFQTDVQVCESAGNLYVSISNAIEELFDAILALSSSKKSEWFQRLRKPKTERIIHKKQDPDDIMQNVHDAIKEFEATVDACRDEHIQNTHVKVEEVLHVSVETAEQIRNLGDRVSNGFENMDQHLIKQSQDVEALQKKEHMLYEALLRLQTILQSKEDATMGLVTLLGETQKKNRAMAVRLAKKDRELQLYKKPQDISTGEIQRSKAVISLRRLLHILSAATPDQISANNSSIDFERLLAQRDKDLETILSWSSRIEPGAQAQAHSVFDQDRFFQWIRSEHPDMLLVDGNLFVRGAVPLEKISAMSLFCANFILSMNSLDSSHVLLHFHCGLHSNVGDDWYGPNGLVRSMIIQVLATLYDRDQLDLNILNRRSFIQTLENHSLDELCIFLHQLIRQFSPDTAVFLVIDGISYFDLDLRGLYKRLATVLECLQQIVEDDNLRPKFKVLMTTPTKSSWRLGKVVQQRYRLGLPLSRLNPLQLSQSRVKMALGGDQPE